MKQLLIALFPLITTAQVAVADSVRCEYLLESRAELLTPKAPLLRGGKITGPELSLNASQKFSVIPEFTFIREEAEKRGLRVWLFGGTAASYLHYVKWDLARQKGIKDLQEDRFDYDFTNIFRSTQDLDIVVDATAAQAKEFEQALGNKFPHFLGAKTQWEVRTLRTRMGEPGTPTFKEALLDDPDFSNQNSDSNSLGMVEVTRSKEPVIRDLRHWSQAQSPFLDDTLNNRISFFRSPQHFTTVRAKVGQNPEILSVIRLLVKAFQYELTFSAEDFRTMKTIVDQFDPQAGMSEEAKRFIEKTAKKLIMHATNIEYAMNKMDELGLRQKLMSMGNTQESNSAAWWLNKEPLRSKPLGQGHGKTAAELGVQVVAHETNSFLAYESIARSHSGEPNVLISRNDARGEAALYGNGFYTRIGRFGARGTGLTIRFIVNPKAREGADFIRHEDYIIFQNKKALKIIQESLNFGLDDLMKMVEGKGNLNVDPSDLAMLEKLKRKLNASKISDELEKLFSSSREEDHERLVQILTAFQESQMKKLLSPETLYQVTKNIYGRVAPLASSKQEADQIRYISTVVPILKSLDTQSLLKLQDFHNYLDHVIQAPGASLAFRKRAAFEQLFSIDNFEESLKFKKAFSRNELDAVLKEIRQWHHSADVRERNFAEGLNQKWSEAMEIGDINKIEALIQSELFDINYKNVSGYSALLLADYYGHKNVIQWLIAEPEFDFMARDARGFNQIEQLRLLEKNDLANEIERARPEVKSRKFSVKERHADGSPILGFVPIIKPGEQKSFMMKGDGRGNVLVKLTRPFEMMSTSTTQSQWVEVFNLLDQIFPGEFQSERRQKWGVNPSKIKEDSLPVDTVSFDEIETWINGLNKLSAHGNSGVQAKLSRVFAGHKKGHQYRLPTEAERQFVQSNQGLAEGKFSFGNSEDALEQSAWSSSNSEDKSHPVGSKKPLMVNGRPIYDIQGNVFEWVADWYEHEKLAGGTDPTGPAVVPYPAGRVITGGSWKNTKQQLLLGARPWPGMSPSSAAHDLGFRLVRVAK